MNPNTAIREIMTIDLITIGQEDCISAIRAVFEKHDFHHLLVVEKGEQLVGIISKKDFLKMVHFGSPDATEKTGTGREDGVLVAKDIMTKYPIHLDPEDSIGLAADIFLANKFHALPIVEDGKLSGILTTHDLLEYIFKSPVEESSSETLT